MNPIGNYCHWRMIEIGIAILSGNVHPIMFVRMITLTLLNRQLNRYDSELFARYRSLDHRIRIMFD
jgi:hypothetical protein